MGRINKNWLFCKLVIYFGVALLVSELAYLQIQRYLEHCMGQCYSPTASTVFETNGVRIPFYYDSEYNSTISKLVDYRRYQTLRQLTHIVPVVLFGTAILVAAILFYHNNLRKPLKQLKIGMDKIAHQDLEFEITYHRQDELGKLCEVFENMRQNLKDTFYEYWKSEEQQANLYSSIAHDLRTPLTILKGNNDVLRFLVENDSDPNKMTETIDLSEDAIKRMERYTDALKQMKALEKWDKVIEEVEISAFADKVCGQGRKLAEVQQKNLQVVCLASGTYCLDQTLIQLVLDRLIENAIRFAKDKIEVRITCCNEEAYGIKHVDSRKSMNGMKCLDSMKDVKSVKYVDSVKHVDSMKHVDSVKHIRGAKEASARLECGSKLCFEVCDDGDGFSPMALKKGTTLFFTSDSSRKHSGIGLAAADSLLKNYKSSLHVENQSSGGARVWFKITELQRR